MSDDLRSERVKLPSLSSSSSVPPPSGTDNATNEMGSSTELKSVYVSNYEPNTVKLHIAQHTSNASIDISAVQIQRLVNKERKKKLSFVSSKITASIDIYNKIVESFWPARTVVNEFIPVSKPQRRNTVYPMGKGNKIKQKTKTKTNRQQSKQAGKNRKSEPEISSNGKSNRWLVVRRRQHPKR